MGAIKHAFSKIGHGIEHAVSGLGKEIKGVGKVIGGCVTFNPHEIKSGVSDVGNGIKQGITGLGEIAGGAAGGIVGATPLGAAINTLTHDGLSKLVEGVGDSCANVLKTGVDGVGEFGKGLASGNLQQMFKGAFDVGQVAMLAVPGAGEVEAADLAMTAGRGLLKKGVENEVQNG